MGKDFEDKSINKMDGFSDGSAGAPNNPEEPGASERSEQLSIEELDLPEEIEDLGAYGLYGALSYEADTALAEEKMRNTACAEEGRGKNTDPGAREGSSGRKKQEEGLQTGSPRNRSGARKSTNRQKPNRQSANGQRVRRKAEPGVRIRGIFVPYTILRRALLVFVILFVLILAGGVYALTHCGGAEEPLATASEALQREIAETEPETTLSAEEIAEQKRRSLEDSVLATYNNLGIVTTSSGGYINLRSAPDSVDMTNIIGKLPNNAACDILENDGEWALVSSGGIQGYASSAYIVTGEEAEALARPQMKERAVVRTEKLNMRSAPEINPENVVGSALLNERYELLGLEGDWAQIKVDTIEGITEAYINIADGNAEIMTCLDGAKRLDLRQMVLTQFDNLVISNTGDYLNVRETPEDSSIDNICGKFPSHAGGELLETVQSDDGRTWYKIKSGPVTGYVSADYCATGERAKELALEGAVLTAMVNTEALNVRSEPSTEASAWTQIAKGQEYHVLDQLDGWVEIELDASDGDDEADRAYVSTRDNNVEVRYGLPEAIEYYPAVEAANAAAAFRNEIVNYACQFVGNPYVWGGTSLTNGADCSGFVMKVLEHFGISVPRVSRDQAKAGVRVTSANMKPGDLVFYANSRGVVNHVGMYIGNGQVVNAASRRSGIRIYPWNYRTPVAIRNVIGP